MQSGLHILRVIDSHTEGEPTRVIVGGGPDLLPPGSGKSVAAQLQVFRERFDHMRRAVVNEPRGNDFLVGAMVCPPATPKAVCGVIFFNNVGFLNACGHGTLGLAATLRHMGRIGVGSHIVETPVGDAAILIAGDGSISIDNVPAFRARKGATVTFDWRGKPITVSGDVAWGGNWFFLCSDHHQELSLANVETLTEFAWQTRQALAAAAITGDTTLGVGGGGGVIDHIELFGPPSRDDCDSKNFVLCPGKAYDRSPCGTGTAAKMACLHADGKLALSQLWRQESIIGSRFTGSVRIENGQLIPTISGRAFVTAEATLVLDPRDPFCHGITQS